MQMRFSVHNPVAEVCTEHAIAVHQLFGIDVNERRTNSADSGNMKIIFVLPTCTLTVERLSKPMDRFERLKHAREEMSHVPLY